MGLGDAFGPHCDPAWVGVFDHGHRGLVALVVGRSDGRIGIDVVVVGHRLAVQLLGTGQSCAIAEGSPGSAVNTAASLWCGFSPYRSTSARCQSPWQWPTQSTRRSCWLRQTGTGPPSTRPPLRHTSRYADRPGRPTAADPQERTLRPGQRRQPARTHLGRPPRRRCDGSWRPLESSPGRRCRSARRARLAQRPRPRCLRTG